MANIQGQYSSQIQSFQKECYHNNKARETERQRKRWRRRRRRRRKKQNENKKKRRERERERERERRKQLFHSGGPERIRVLSLFIQQISNWISQSGSSRLIIPTATMSTTFSCIIITIAITTSSDNVLEQNHSYLLAINSVSPFSSKSSTDLCIAENINTKSPIFKFRCFKNENCLDMRYHNRYNYHQLCRAVSESRFINMSIQQFYRELVTSQRLIFHSENINRSFRILPFYRHCYQLFGYLSLQLISLSTCHRSLGK